MESRGVCFARSLHLDIREHEGSQGSSPSLKVKVGLFGHSGELHSPEVFTECRNDKKIFPHWEVEEGAVNVFSSLHF